MARPGPEMWRACLDAWLEPFLAALPRAEQRRWASLYVQGNRDIQRTVDNSGDGSVDAAILPLLALPPPPPPSDLHHQIVAELCVAEPRPGRVAQDARAPGPHQVHRVVQVPMHPQAGPAGVGQV